MRSIAGLAAAMLLGLLLPLTAWAQTAAAQGTTEQAGFLNNYNDSSFLDLDNVSSSSTSSTTSTASTISTASIRTAAAQGPNGQGAAAQGSEGIGQTTTSTIVSTTQPAPDLWWDKPLKAACTSTSTTVHQHVVVPITTTTTTTNNATNTTTTTTTNTTTTITTTTTNFTTTTTTTLILGDMLLPTTDPEMTTSTTTPACPVEFEDDDNKDDNWWRYVAVGSETIDLQEGCSWWLPKKRSTEKPQLQRIRIGLTAPFTGFQAFQNERELRGLIVTLAYAAYAFNDYAIHMRYGKIATQELERLSFCVRDDKSSELVQQMIYKRFLQSPYEGRGEVDLWLGPMWSTTHQKNLLYKLSNHHSVPLIYWTIPPELYRMDNVSRLPEAFLHRLKMTGTLLNNAELPVFYPAARPSGFFGWPEACNQAKYPSRVYSRPAGTKPNRDEPADESEFLRIAREKAASYADYYEQVKHDAINAWIMDDWEAGANNHSFDVALLPGDSVKNAIYRLRLLGARTFFMAILYQPGDGSVQGCWQAHGYANKMGMSTSQFEFHGHPELGVVQEKVQSNLDILFICGTPFDASNFVLKLAADAVNPKAILFSQPSAFYARDGALSVYSAFMFEGIPWPVPDRPVDADNKNSEKNKNSTKWQLENGRIPGIPSSKGEPTPLYTPTNHEEIVCEYRQALGISEWSIAADMVNIALSVYLRVLTWSPSESMAKGPTWIAKTIRKESTISIFGNFTFKSDGHLVVRPEGKLVVRPDGVIGILPSVGTLQYRTPILFRSFDQSTLEERLISYSITIPFFVDSSLHAKELGLAFYPDTDNQQATFMPRRRRGVTIMVKPPSYPRVTWFDAAVNNYPCRDGCQYTTILGGAAGTSSCVPCGKGNYRPYGALDCRECPPGKYADKPMMNRCLECDANSKEKKCLNSTVETPWALPGYFRFDAEFATTCTDMTEDKDATFMACPTDTNCLGSSETASNVCRVHREGSLCQACENHYSKHGLMQVNTECNECPSTTVFSELLLACIPILTTMYTSRTICDGVEKSNRKAVSTFRIVENHIKVVAIIFIIYRMDKFDKVESIITDIGNVIWSVGVSLAAPMEMSYWDCHDAHTYSDVFFIRIRMSCFQLLGYVFFTLLFLVRIKLSGTNFCPCLTREADSAAANRAKRLRRINAQLRFTNTVHDFYRHMIIFAGMSYIGLVVTWGLPLRCLTFADGNLRMDAHPILRCDNKDFIWFRVSCITLVLLFALGVPLVFLYILQRKPLMSAEIVQRLINGHLVLNITQRYQNWYGVWSVAKLSIYALLVVVRIEDAFIKNVGGVLLTFIIAAPVFIYEGVHANNEHRAMDQFSGVVLILTSFLGVIGNYSLYKIEYQKIIEFIFFWMTPEEAQSHIQEAISTMVIVLNVLFLVKVVVEILLTFFTAQIKSFIRYQFLGGDLNRAVCLYEDDGLKGHCLVLKEGTYSAEDIHNMGLVNASVCSLRVFRGYKMILSVSDEYTEWNPDFPMGTYMLADLEASGGGGNLKAIRVKRHTTHGWLKRLLSLHTVELTSGGKNRGHYLINNIGDLPYRTKVLFTDDVKMLTQSLVDTRDRVDARLIFVPLELAFRHAHAATIANKYQTYARFVDAFEKKGLPSKVLRCFIREPNWQHLVEFCQADLGVSADMWHTAIVPIVYDINEGSAELAVVLANADNSPQKAASRELEDEQKSQPSEDSRKNTPRGSTPRGTGTPRATPRGTKHPYEQMETEPPVAEPGFKDQLDGLLENGVHNKLMENNSKEISTSMALRKSPYMSFLCSSLLDIGARHVELQEMKQILRPLPVAVSRKTHRTMESLNPLVDWDAHLHAGEVSKNVARQMTRDMVEQRRTHSATLRSFKSMLSLKEDEDSFKCTVRPAVDAQDTNLFLTMFRDTLRMIGLLEEDVAEMQMSLQADDGKKSHVLIRSGTEIISKLEDLKGELFNASVLGYRIGGEPRTKASSAKWNEKVTPATPAHMLPDTVTVHMKFQHMKYAQVKSHLNAAVLDEFEDGIRRVLCDCLHAMYLLHDDITLKYYTGSVILHAIITVPRGTKQTVTETLEDGIQYVVRKVQEELNAIGDIPKLGLGDGKIPKIVECAVLAEDHKEGDEGAPRGHRRCSMYLDDVPAAAEGHGIDKPVQDSEGQLNGSHEPVPESVSRNIDIDNDNIEPAAQEDAAALAEIDTRWSDPVPPDISGTWHYKVGSENKSYSISAHADLPGLYRWQEQYESEMYSGTLVPDGREFRGSVVDGVGAVQGEVRLRLVEEDRLLSIFNAGPDVYASRAQASDSEPPEPPPPPPPALTDGPPPLSNGAQPLTDEPPPLSNGAQPLTDEPPPLKTELSVIAEEKTPLSNGEQTPLPNGETHLPSEMRTKANGKSKPQPPASLNGHDHLFVAAQPAALASEDADGRDSALSKSEKARSDLRREVEDKQSTVSSWKLSSADSMDGMLNFRNLVMGNLEEHDE